MKAVPNFLYQNLINVLTNHLSENRGVHPCGQYNYVPWEAYHEPKPLQWKPGMVINDETKEAFIRYIREVRDLPNLNVIQLIVDLGIRDNKVAAYNLIKAVIMENE